MSRNDSVAAQDRAEERVDRWVGRYLRFWRWVAVFACARLNGRLWPEQHTYVVTQTGEPRGS